MTSPNTIYIQHLFGKVLHSKIGFGCLIEKLFTDGNKKHFVVKPLHFALLSGQLHVSDGKRRAVNKIGVYYFTILFRPITKFDVFGNKLQFKRISDQCIKSL